jgi:REP element-mobilizing transposase RayT
MLFITMRTHRRTFFFSPNDEVNQVINYLVAYASERHGVGISGMVWQSNHAHLLVNDHRGEVSAFLQTLNGAIARGLNRKVSTRMRQQCGITSEPLMPPCSW